MWFSIVLTVLFVITGLGWLADKLYFQRKRTQAAQHLRDSAKGDVSIEPTIAQILMRPVWLEYTAGLFGVIGLVFVLRSFVVEPFRIPSGSMLPNLYVGDFILVNKYTYGLRMPISNDVIVPMNHPQRGDVVVFQFPPEPSESYIKRVIGVPGDVIRYEKKVLTVNGVVYNQTPQSGTIPTAEYPTIGKDDTPMLGVPLSKFAEKGATTHDILTIDNQPTVNPSGFNAFGFKRNTKACVFLADNAGLECTVPQGHYFMMGDNRDNSTDSRYWGFVSEEHIVGKAYFVWMNFSHSERIGKSIK